MFSGQKLAAVPTMPEAKIEVEKGKEMEMEEVLERMRSLLVEVRQKEEEGARWVISLNLAAILTKKR